MFTLLKRIVLFAVIVVLVVQLFFLSCIAWWRYANPVSTSFMRARLSEMQINNPNAALKHQWVDYSRISSSIKRAVVAAEDGKFVDHGGVDWTALQQAYQRNNRRGKVTHGGSTISQQLAKNLFLSSERSYVRKSQELLITWMLEALLSKRRIFEIYLNSVEWGNGVFGIEAASRYYFATSAANLSPRQAARLAAMLPAPRYFDRNRNSAGLARKAATIEARLPQVSVPK